MMRDIQIAAPTTYDVLEDAYLRGVWSASREVTYVGSVFSGSAPLLTFGKLTRHVVISNTSGAGWWANITGDPLPDDPTINAPLWYDVIVLPGQGWNSSGDRGHGHGLYVQCVAGRGKVVDSCIIGGGFGNALHAYATNTDTAHDFVFHKTIFMGKQSLVGGVAFGADNITFEDCVFVDSMATMGYLAPNGSVTFRRCVFLSTLGTPISIGNQNQTNPVTSWQHVTFIENTVIADGGIYVNKASAEAMATWEFDNNHYYGLGWAPFVVNGEVMSFAQWQETLGFDQHSVLSPDKPANPLYWTIPIHIRGRQVVNVVAYNPSSASSLTFPPEVPAGTQQYRDLWDYDVVREGAAFAVTPDVAFPVSYPRERVEASPLPKKPSTLSVFRVDLAESESEVLNRLLIEATRQIDTARRQEKSPSG